jgi:hypothetical protein
MTILVLNWRLRDLLKPLKASGRAMSKHVIDQPRRNAMPLCLTSRHPAIDPLLAFNLE